MTTPRLLLALILALPFTPWCSPTVEGMVAPTSGTSKSGKGAQSGLTLARWAGGWCTWSEAMNWLPPVVPDNDPGGHIDLGHGLGGGQGGGQGGQGGQEFFVVIGRNGAVDSVVTLETGVTIARLSIRAGDALIIEPGGALSLAHTGGPVVVMNRGDIALGSGLWGAELRLAQMTELQGSGILSLGDETMAMVRAAEAAEGASLPHGPLLLHANGLPTLLNTDNLIRGAGRLGLGEIALVNHALIDADVFQRAITIQPNDAGCTNRGVMQASGGGWLRLTDGSFDNEDGVIAALHGSFVEHDGAAIHGGVLTTSGSGVIRVMAAPAAWRDVTNNGNYMLGPTSLHWDGHITNDGLIQIVGDLAATTGPPASEVVLDPAGLGAVTLAGDGVLTMLSAIIHAPVGSPDVDLIHDTPHTMRGEGRIGSGRTSFFNHGTVIADQNLMLLMNPGLGRVVENHGQFVASGSGGLGLLSGSFENFGTLEVRDGSRFITIPGSTVVNAGGGALVGGTWRVMAEQLPTMLNITCGNILTNAADVTLSGPGSLFPRFDTVSFNAGTIRLRNGRVFTTSASFSNYGAIEIGAGSTLAVSGAFTQGSDGVLHLQVAGASSDPARLTTSGNATLGGAVEIVFVEGMELGAGEVLSIITAGAVSGGFSSVTVPPGVELHYTPTAVVIAAME